MRFVGLKNPFVTAPPPGVLPTFYRSMGRRASSKVTKAPIGRGLAQDHHRERPGKARPAGQPSAATTGAQTATGFPSLDDVHPSPAALWMGLMVSMRRVML